ncbi:MAG: radical SAM protein [Candidatus Omnitrophica bacterium]|nr:radical SAM protein [Candidatus Omnitrophota bacterium]
MIIRELDYPSFYTKFFERDKYALPKVSALEITHRCNYKCIHCYIEDEHLTAKIDKRELKLKNIYKILDKLANAGVLWLVLSGGEPLAHRDFFKIYRYAKKKGFLIIIYTNAALIDFAAAEFFKKNPPFEIQISLYATDRRIYEEITQVAGSFNRCLAGINFLLKNGVRIGIKTPLFRQNKDQISRVKDFAISRGIRFMCNPVLFPPLHDTCLDSIESCLATVKDVLQVEKNEYGQSRSRTLKEFYRKIKEDERRGIATTNYCQKLDQLNSALKGMIITPCGDLDVNRYFPCIKQKYNLVKRGITACWQDFLKKLAEERDQNDCFCKKCAYLAYCGICFNLLDNPDSAKGYTKIKNYYCKIARLRKENGEKQ